MIAHEDHESSREPSRRWRVCLRCALGVVLACIPMAGGCRRTNLVPPPPTMFQSPPTLPELLTAVNAHSDRIMDVQTDSGRLTVPGYPGLRANLRVLRPRHLRLQASFMSNRVLDTGSNDQQFWLWSTGEPVLYARHDQFAQSAASQLLPVEPTWLVDALGLIHFDPQGPHRGPFQRADGAIEVHTPMATGAGQRIRVVAIHPTYGYITEVQMRDASGQLLALAQADRHQYNLVEKVTLPHRVHLKLNAPQLAVQAFTFETDSYVVNQLQSAAANPNLWMMPPGPSQNLAAAGLQLPPVNQGAGLKVAPRQPGDAAPMGVDSGQPAWRQAEAQPSLRPEFRGYRRE